MVWYEQSFRAFNGAWESREALGERIARLLAAGVQPVLSINTYLRCIRAFLRWAHARARRGARRDSLKRLLVRSIERDIPIRHLHPILCRGRQFFETPSRAFRATVPPDPPVPSRPGPAARRNPCRHPKSAAALDGRGGEHVGGSLLIDARGREGRVHPARISGDTAEQWTCGAKLLRGTLWNGTFAELSEAKLQAVPPDPSGAAPQPPISRAFRPERILFSSRSWVFNHGSAKSRLPWAMIARLAPNWNRRRRTPTSLGSAANNKTRLGASYGIVGR